MTKKNNPQNLLRRWENSWIFWTIFILGFIELVSTLLAGIAGTIYGTLYFPLGLIFLIPPLRNFIMEVLILQWGYIFAYYGLLGFIVSIIVRDKKFNTKLILLLIGILILTFIGCTQSTGQF